MKVEDYRMHLQNFITKLPMTEAEIAMFVAFQAEVVVYFEQNKSAQVVPFAEVLAVQSILRRIKLHCARQTLAELRGEPIMMNFQPLQAELLEDFYSMLELGFPYAVKFPGVKNG